MHGLKFNGYEMKQKWFNVIVGTMKLVRRLVLTKSTPIVLTAKLGIKLKVIMSPFISRLLLGQKV